MTGLPTAQPGAPAPEPAGRAAPAGGAAPPTARPPAAGAAPAGGAAAAGKPALLAAFGLFTVIPVGAGPRMTRRQAARAVAWLPVVGALIALPAAGVLVALEGTGHSASRDLLAATLAFAVVAVLTGGLHLDGLADTTDGLGSRRPRDEALAIMRRSDAGPFGVVALVVVVLVQIASLASLHPPWLAAGALVAAVVTGRVAVVLATGPGSPAARPDGFGALVAGGTPGAVRVGELAALVAAGAAASVPAGGLPLLARGGIAVAAGLLAAELLRLLARRQLGGMTGDVFGALIEVSTAAVLLVAVLTGGLGQ